MNHAMPVLCTRSLFGLLGPFLHTQPILDEFCLQLGVEIQHASGHSRTSAAFHLLMFVSPLGFEHGKSYLLPDPQKRLYYHDVVGDI